MVEARGALAAHADALARSGHARDAAAAARRGWTGTPGDAEAETALLSRHGVALTAEDKAALVAFLESLTGARPALLRAAR